MTVGRLTQPVLLLVSVVAIALIGSSVTHYMIVENMAMNDLMPRYVGCQAFYQGNTPYSDTVAAEIIVFTGDPWPFAYPAHLCLVLAPFWLMPYTPSAALWTFLNLALFLTFPLVFSLYVLRWRMPALLMLVFTLGVVLGFRYTLMTITLSQFTGFVLLCLVGAVWGLREQRPWLTALCLAGMTIRPDGGVIAAGLIAVAILVGQWRVLPIWLAALLIIWLGSRLMIGDWELRFIQHLGEYRELNRKTSWLPLDLGAAGAVLLCVMMTGWTAVMAVKLRRWIQPYRRDFVMWACVVIVIVVLLFFPQTNPYTLVYALPIFIYFSYVLRSHPALRLLPALLLFLSWFFFLSGIWRYDQIFFPVALAALALFALQQYQIKAWSLAWPSSGAHEEGG